MLSLQNLQLRKLIHAPHYSCSISISTASFAESKPRPLQAHLGIHMWVSVPLGTTNAQVFRKDRKAQTSIDWRGATCIQRATVGTGGIFDGKRGGLSGFRATKPVLLAPTLAATRLSPPSVKSLDFMPSYRSSLEWTAHTSSTTMCLESDPPAHPPLRQSRLQVAEKHAFPSATSQPPMLIPTPHNSPHSSSLSPWSTDLGSPPASDPPQPWQA
jgi:hypothetical protein